MNIDRYAGLIERGEVVAFPTETVYGLGADAWNPIAIQKVFDLKGRPADNPLIIHIAEKKNVIELAREVPDSVQLLMDVCWPGPLTLILPKKKQVPDIATAGLQTVAIRMPDHPLALEFIGKTGPLVAPSANKSGRPSPTSPLHIKEDFGHSFPILDGGTTKIGIESTVLDCSETPWQILRPGAISHKQIEQVTKNRVEPFQRNNSRAIRSPGQKYRHYAPKAKVKWMGNKSFKTNSDILYLVHSFREIPDSKNIVHFKRDLKRMAKQLYDLFRYADKSGYRTILIQPFEQKYNSVWEEALQNRIEKAIGR